MIKMKENEISGGCSSGACEIIFEDKKSDASHESGFDSKQRMIDALNSEKYIGSMYNTFLFESATTSFRNCMSGLLEDEHQMQHEIYNELSTRGWYKTDKAEDSKINCEKQKYYSEITK